jgi:hypothetical protein
MMAKDWKLKVNEIESSDAYDHVGELHTFTYELHVFELLRENEVLKINLDQTTTNYNIYINI